MDVESEYEAKGECGPVTEGLAEELGIDKLRPGCCGSVALQAAGATLCGSFLFGYCLAVLNTSFLTINAEYGWCDVPAQSDCDNSVTLGALINTAVFIGATFGAIITQWFIYLGCRTNMLMSFGVIAVGTICCLVSNSFAALFWGRLFVGYGVGITSLVTPMYIAEISPAHVRGSYGTLHQLTICVGIFLSILILPSAILLWIDEDSSVTQWMSVASAIVFICVFACSHDPVIWVFLFEIYPAEIKGMATALGTAFHWIFAVVITYLNAYLGSNQIIYTILTATNFTSILIVFFMMKETKGRSIDDSPYFTKSTV
eukprot:Polyplicarium_translucidae@DN3356_c0_g1_i2.p1